MFRIHPQTAQKLAEAFSCKAQPILLKKKQEATSRHSLLSTFNY